MHWLRVFTSGLAFAGLCEPASTAGIEALVRRRLPQHAYDFEFTLINITSLALNASQTTPDNDQYFVSNGLGNKIRIAGNTPSALSSGLRWYLSNVLHLDIYWFIGSRLYLAPEILPRLNSTHHGTSTVPWRYHFNTVTFSYTAAFWNWQDWELQLDWLALRGVNLALAWNGYEKILIDVLAEANFSKSDISSFLSGPAFQGWNRFGNIQGSWGGDLPTEWIDGQFNLNKRIVSRMVELGITPVLPSFTGFVPKQIEKMYPHAAFVNSSQWSGFPIQYTNVTFLEPFDPLYQQWQKDFISKQNAAYGNVTHIYTLDQYNENNPYSGNLSYLKSISTATIQSLKAADPAATWLLQGWLFFSSQSFWNPARIEAYLEGVDDSDMLILDLFSESQPQWQRYYSKPWIWCELHGYGGNMGLYGQLENVTVSSVEARRNQSTNMVGMGLIMEGQEGNEIMYDIALDQAWSLVPINTKTYFRDWVTSRYNNGRLNHGFFHAPLPSGVYTAWDLLRKTVYNNTNLNLAQATTKSIFELSPNTTGLLNRTGHHPTTITYDPRILVQAWGEYYSAALSDPSLWESTPYIFDLTDITRQVLANAFYPLYVSFVAQANSSNNATYAPPAAVHTGHRMLALLQDLDAVLTASTIPHFNLEPWIAEARAWARASPLTTNNVTAEEIRQIADYYEYNARNQITLWGPTGQISDYASKQWGGLIRSYYVPRWQRFIEYTLNSTFRANGVNPELKASLLAFEEQWQTRTLGDSRKETFTNPILQDSLPTTIALVKQKWDAVLQAS